MTIKSDKQANPSAFAAFSGNRSAPVGQDGMIPFSRINLSQPAPEWLSLNGDEASIIHPGFYCIFFSASFDQPGVSLALRLNGRTVPGSESISDRTGAPVSGSVTVSVSQDAPRMKPTLVAVSSGSSDINVLSCALLITQFKP